jgi:membrane protein YdbS with pleckstrin-like domain
MTSAAVPGTREPFDPTDVTWTPVSGRLIGARLTVTAIVLGPVLVLLVLLAVLVGQAWLWVFPAMVLLLVGWIAWLVPRQVGALAYAERGDDLLVRRGIMFRSLVVVPYGRMQYVDVNAGPLARKFGIASVQLHTASPATSASIDGLPPHEAARLRDRMASRGEARLAGL